MARGMKRWVVAVVLGCGLFAAGLVAGRLRYAPEGAPDHSAVLASFAGGNVTAAELQAALAEQGPMLRGSADSAEAQRRLVDELARQKLIERAAIAKGYDRAPEMIRDRRRLLTAFYLRKEFEEPESRRSVTDAELGAFLERHKAEYERPERVRIADIFVAAPADGPGRRKKAAEATEMLRQLQKRAAHDYYAFATLARQRSDDPATRPFGGELPLASRDELAARLGPDVAKAAFALRGNGTLAARPVETKGGFHLLQLHAREEAASADLASLRNVLRGRALAERRAKDQEAFYAALERDAGLNIDAAAVAALRVDSGGRAAH